MNNRMILWCVLVLTHRVQRMTWINGLLVPRAANISDNFKVCSLIGAGMNNRMNLWCVVLAALLSPNVTIRADLSGGCVDWQIRLVCN
jgi:hypothetical protein